MTAEGRTVQLKATRSTVDRHVLSGQFEGMTAWDVRNHVGESPVWDSQQGTLVWIDVRKPAVLELDPGFHTVTQWQLPHVVGALVQSGERQFMLALHNCLAEFDAATGLLRMHDPVEEEVPGNRLNEGKLSPSGRWFVFGSMDDRPTDKRPTGALYCSDLQGRVCKVYDGLTTANGIAWTPGGDQIYFSDSFAGTIWKAKWNEALGSMGTPTIFARSDEASGRPDGACVDLLGNYLSAGVSAGQINKFDPSGRRCLTLAVPVRAPTMLCPGGSDMSRVFLTSLVRPTWPVSKALDGALIEFGAELLGSSFS